MKTKTTLLALSLAMVAPLAMAQTAAPRTANEPVRTDAAAQVERPDAWVLTKVKTQFAASDIVDATDINVDVQNGIVTLRGTIATDAEKQEALRIAKATEGVKSVNTAGLKMTTVGADAKSKANHQGHEMEEDRYKKNNK
jgi:hyperosmotically inducible protein